MITFATLSVIPVLAIARVSRLVLDSKASNNLSNFSGDIFYKSPQEKEHKIQNQYNPQAGVDFCRHQGSGMLIGIP